MKKDKDIYEGLELPECLIRVIGIGGAGTKVVEGFMDKAPSQVELIALDRDSYVKKARLQKILLIDCPLRGLCQNRAAIREGFLAAEGVIREAVEGCPILICVAGLGGFTSLEALPILSSIARELDAPAIFLLAMPFSFEGPRRMSSAKETIAILRSSGHVVIPFPNTRLLEKIDKDKTTLAEILLLSDESLSSIIRAFTGSLMSRESLITLNISDILMVLKEGNLVDIGIGAGRGDEGKDLSVMEAMDLFSGNRVEDASGVMAFFEIGRGFCLFDINEAMQIFYERVDEDALVCFGAFVNNEVEDIFKTTVIAVFSG